MEDDVINLVEVQSNPQQQIPKPPESIPQTQEKMSNRDRLDVISEMTEVMRDDPAVSSAIDVVRATADIWVQIQPMLARRGEFEAASLPDEVHRTFTPLFAGIVSSRRGSELLDIAMDQHTQIEAEELWEAMQEGHTYTPELVVGSGIHASIYNAERMSDDPSMPALTVEGEDTEGGQFAAPEGPVFRTNTRTRPEHPDVPNVPGTAGSLNHFEGHGVLQQADITGAAYGTQDTLGIPVRVNHLLYSKILNECKVVSVAATDPEQAQEAGRYTVRLSRQTEPDKEPQEVTITTDRIVFASGLGEAVTGFESSDDTTKAILAEEMEKAERGETSQIMTFAQFAERVGDESEPFPLRGFEYVAVVGPGDGGAVAVEYLLGHGPDTRLSTAQLDFVKQVFWIGQKNATREELANSIRTRYMGLSLEMPVDKDSGYHHRITPIGGRAYKLERTEDERIRILHGSRGENGEIVPDDEVVVDHLILSTGFEKRTDEICHTLLSPGTTSLSETVTTPEGWPVARRIPGEEVYTIGPAAALPVSHRDAELSPAMRRGKEIDGTVAIWASGEETRATAKYLGKVTPDGERPAGLTTVEKERPIIELPSFAPTEAELLQVPFEIESEAIKSLLRYDAVSEDISRLSVGMSLHDYRFPESLEGLRIEVTRVPSETDNISFTASIDSQIPNSEAYARAISQVMSEPHMQAVLVRLTDRSVHSSQTAVLDIPFMQRKASLGEVEIRVKRR